MRLYKLAGPQGQSRFNHAVSSTIIDMLQLPVPLTVTRVTDHIDGVVVELELDDTLLPGGWSSAGVGDLLIKRVVQAECATSLIRQTYAEYLGGNPQKVFFIDAAFLQYKVTPGMRHRLDIVSHAKSAASTAAKQAMAPDDPMEGGQDDSGPPTSRLDDFMLGPTTPRLGRPVAAGAPPSSPFSPPAVGLTVGQQQRQQWRAEAGFPRPPSQVAGGSFATLTAPDGTPLRDVNPRFVPPPGALKPSAATYLDMFLIRDKNGPRDRTDVADGIDAAADAVPKGTPGGGPHQGGAAVPTAFQSTPPFGGPAAGGGVGGGFSPVSQAVRSWTGGAGAVDPAAHVSPMAISVYERRVLGR